MPTARNLEITDPRALRALAHPVRLTLVGLLRREGPLTATQAGELVGESPASCSFHLRQLAKYGFVEEAGGGRGRERPWRATALFTSWPNAPGTPELAAASQALSAVVAEKYFEQVRRWIAARSAEPSEWQEASIWRDTILYVTPSELEEIGRRLNDVVEPFLERIERREARPEGARQVTLVTLGIPVEDERG